MALAIKIVPTLEGVDAQRFSSIASEVESNPHSVDYTHQADVVRKYLDDIKL